MTAIRSTQVWSATPTPFTETMDVDAESVKRMVDHHLRLGVNGLFLGGTSGEGPWMTDRQRRVLVRSVARRVKGRMVIAVQVTDNSALRILDNIKAVRDCGADIAVVAAPFFMLNDTPERVLNHYLEVIRNSDLPVGVYDRGKLASVPLSNSAMKKICTEENVTLVKDSSANLQRMKLCLACRRKRPELRLLNGWEFNCIPYLRAGYDGLLLGGGIFNGHLAREIIKTVHKGDLALAERLQQRMNRMMYSVYGGQKLRCWLTGLKKLLVEMGIFQTCNSFLHYPLSQGCSRAIDRVLKNDVDVLFPWRQRCS